MILTQSACHVIHLPSDKYLEYVCMHDVFIHVSLSYIPFWHFHCVIWIVYKSAGKKKGLFVQIFLVFLTGVATGEKFEEKLLQKGHWTGGILFFLGDLLDGCIFFTPLSCIYKIGFCSSTKRADVPTGFLLSPLEEGEGSGERLYNMTKTKPHTLICNWSYPSKWRRFVLLLL